jgi:hypothetical protein
LIGLLPQSLSGRHVIVPWSATGLLALICAVRQAKSVTCIEESESGVNLSEFNAALNSLIGSVSVRRGQFDTEFDTELDAGYDAAVAQLPGLVGISEMALRQTSNEIESDGASKMAALLRALSRAGGPADGFVICRALGDRTSVFLNRELQSQIVGADRTAIRSYILNKTPWQPHNVGVPQPDAQIKQDELYEYSELLRVRIGQGESGISNLPFYSPALVNVSAAEQPCGMADAGS